jgi:hypothetical protein
MEPRVAVNAVHTRRQIAPNRRYIFAVRHDAIDDGYIFINLFTNSTSEN